MITRKDLEPSYQAVQAGHAVAKYLLTYPETEWKNGTLVYLGVRNEKELRRLVYKLEIKRIPYVKFIEPDIGNQITSIASITDNSIFRKLKLL